MSPKRAGVNCVTGKSMCKIRRKRYIGNSSYCRHLEDRQQWVLMCVYFLALVQVSVMVRTKTLSSEPPPCHCIPPPALHPSPPLLKGSSLFSRTSLASVPSSIRSSFVMTPMVRRPERAQKSEDAEREELGLAALGRGPHFQVWDLGQAITSPAWTLVSLMSSEDNSHTSLRGLFMKTHWLVTDAPSVNTGHHHCHSCDLLTVSRCHSVGGDLVETQNPGSVSMLR